MNFLTLLGLKSKNADTRRETVESLADAQDPAVLPNLYPLLLRDEVAEVRKTAAKAIASFRDFESVPVLCDALKDKDPAVRIAVLNGLIKVNDKTITRFVVPLLQDRDLGVQNKAANVLQHFRWTPATQEEEAISLVAAGRFAEAASLGAAAVEPLSVLLDSPSESVRQTGIEVLSTISDSRVWKTIGQGLKDESPNIRITAIEALRRVRDVRVFELLVTALNDVEERIRCVAAEALGYFGQRALEPLINMLKDVSPDVRREASGALQQIDPAWRQSPQAKAILQELGTEAGDIISSFNEEISPLAGSSNLPSLQMVDSVPEFVTDHDEDATLKPLIAELQNGDPTVRFKAARDLGKTGNAGACSALERALEDAVPPVRRAAAEALAALPWVPSDPSLLTVQAILLQKWEDIVHLGSQAVEPLIKALSQFDSLSQKHAAKALGEIGDVRATEPLLVALDSVDMGVRKAAVEALARIGDPRAFEGLMRARSDGSKPVRDAADLGLKELGASDL
ncbi:MAG: HEAT repeat domain-containing protein [Verrucomicrobia bacterium]|nr:HEAT repeat domain-containing protein [Verrucomicrobiota bacterium]